jgi:hypothetical protein
MGDTDLIDAGVIDEELDTLDDDVTTDDDGLGLGDVVDEDDDLDDLGEEDE